MDAADLFAVGLFAGGLLVVYLVARFVTIRRRHVPPEEVRRILVDGSNVMYWDNETPRIETVSRVVWALRDRGLHPAVIFDASVGHVLVGKYQDDAPMAALLGLPVEDVLVVPKGTSADDYLLRVARDKNVSIVTHDRYRDWEASYPEVRKPGKLIRGGYRKGQLWLEPTPDDRKLPGSRAGVRA